MVEEMACIELVERVTDYLEGALPADELAKFGEHLATCDGCEAYLRQMRTAVRILEATPKEPVPPELVDELERLSLPFTEEDLPSDAELRIAQAQLVGWLEGLFHGIQTTLFAQQMAARAQLEQMRRALPPGMMPQPEPDPQHQRPGSGPYL